MKLPFSRHFSGSRRDALLGFLHGRFRITSLRRGLILSASILLITVIIVLAYFFIGVLRQTRLQAEENFSRLSGISRQQVSDTLSAAQESASIAAYSNSVQRYLLSDDPGVVIDARSTVSDMLQYISVYGSGFTDIVFLSDRGRKISITNTYIDLAQEALAVSKTDEEPYFRQPFYSPVMYYKGKNYVVYFFPVYGIIDGYRYRYNPIYGAVIYGMDELLDNVVEGSYASGAAVILQGGKVLGSSRTLTSAETYALDGLSGDERTARIDGERYLVDVSFLEEPEWELIYLTPESAINEGLTEIRNLLALTLLCASLLGVSLMLAILLSVRRSIMQMTAEILLAGKGTKIHPPQIAELLPIADALNSAVGELQEAALREQRLVTEQYEAKLAQTRAEMLAYRSQINPHFLFNTLETVRSLAHRYGAKPVEQLIGGMSQMFRYSLYSPMIVQLEDELGHLGAYFSVMDARFPGRYRVLEDIDPETLFWPVLSMILQPLAENALLHAFAGRRSGILLIQTFIKENRLHVRIADNGVGMKQEILDTVNWRIRNTDSETAHIDGHSDFGPEYKLSIGLPNIYHRIKLTFGEHAHLTIRSKEGYYTVAEIVIPRER